MVTPASWLCPLPGGGTCEEYAVKFDDQRLHRVLIVPALFDEGNRMRRFTVELMRRLDAVGVDSFLPDFPGCNESIQPLVRQDPTDWLDAMTAAARHFRATHSLGIRGGCLFTPDRVPAFHYSPIKASSILRQMIRARILSSREAGLNEHRDHLVQHALATGITLAGYDLGPDFYLHFDPMVPDPSATAIAQEHVGGSGLWLRAEPDENAEQSGALAAILADEINV